METLLSRVYIRAPPLSFTFIFFKIIGKPVSYSCLFPISVTHISDQHDLEMPCNADAFD